MCAISGLKKKNLAKVCSLAVDLRGEAVRATESMDVFAVTEK